MSHSKSHIMGGGSRPIAKLRTSANGSRYRPCVTASRESAIAFAIAVTVAGSSENHSRAQSTVTWPMSASGSRASAAAVCVLSSERCQKPVLRYRIIGPARHGPPSCVHVQMPSMFGFDSRIVCSAHWYSGPRSLGNDPNASNSRRLWSSTMRR